MSIYKTLKPLIYKLDPEKAHDIIEFALKHSSNMTLIQEILAKNFVMADERLSQNIGGLHFYNPVGLAAGYDKNATMIRSLSALGFGFLEIGTITYRPQSGNPKPRIFRHVEEESVQNSMGFNNDGANAISKRLKYVYPYSIPLGVNIGKNRSASKENTLVNYQKSLQIVKDCGDYFVFNLSSPNTPGLRDLQNETFVGELFSMAKEESSKPMFIKIAPDMKESDMLKVCAKAIKSGASGIIATNTTIDYSNIQNPRESGGISGGALRDKSRELFKILSDSFFEKTILISAGGINSAFEAYERIKMGASLVQVYTSLIFEGPSICKNINSGLLELMEEDGIENLKDAIGLYQK